MLCEPFLLRANGSDVRIKSLVEVHFCCIPDIAPDSFCDPSQGWKSTPENDTGKQGEMKHGS
jgi:hypothetical protein